MGSSPKTLETRIKLRLALNKTKIDPRDQSLLQQLRAAFGRLVDQAVDTWVSSDEDSGPVLVWPLQVETTARGLMIGAKTYFQAKSANPEAFRTTFQRVALAEEAKLQAHYGRSLRIEVSEIWERPDGEPSG